MGSTVLAADWKATSITTKPTAAMVNPILLKRRPALVALSPMAQPAVNAQATPPPKASIAVRMWGLMWSYMS